MKNRGVYLMNRKLASPGKEQNRSEIHISFDSFMYMSNIYIWVGGGWFNMYEVNLV